MFTDAPRNLAQGAYVCVNNSGSYAAANQKVADVVGSYELLETQAKQIVGEKIWTDNITPLL